MFQAVLISDFTGHDCHVDPDDHGCGSGRAYGLGRCLSDTPILQCV